MCGCVCVCIYISLTSNKVWTGIVPGVSGFPGLVSCSHHGMFSIHLVTWWIWIVYPNGDSALQFPGFSGSLIMHLDGGKNCLCCYISKSLNILLLSTCFLTPGPSVLRLL